MEAPSPPVGLSGHCSVIEDEVLYTYSPTAFQSLPLQNNGTWSELQNGVAVSGGSCVLQPGSALWVIGGVPTNAADTQYPGLQKYSFATKVWQTIMPLVSVTEDRQGHAAVYLEDAESILVYAGSQDGDFILSTETFLISTQPPYDVESFSAQNIPAVSPLLLPWNTSAAITIGGAVDNRSIFRFQLGSGWEQIFPSLPVPPKASNLEQATLLSGADNSKVLQLYDLSISPNNVTQIVLQNAHGFPAQQGRYIGQPSGKKRKRALTLSDWPPYNDTFAPTATRSGFALTSNSEGTVSISGGGDTAQSVALFDQNGNTWVNTTSFFGASANQKPLISSSSSSIRPSSTATATSSPTSAAAAPLDSNQPSTRLILGASLGSILGFIALLIVFLLLLRWRRHKQAQKRAAEEDEDEDEDDDEKDRMSIVDRGDPFIKETSAPVYPASHHSLSIYENKEGHHQTHTRSATRGSENSTTALVPKRSETFEMSPIRERRFDVSAPANAPVSRSANTLQVPGANREPRRTTGWSRYFSGIDGLASNRTSARSSNPGPPDSSAHSQGESPTQLPPLDMGQQFSEGHVGPQVHSSSGRADDERPVSVVGDDFDARPRTVSSTFSSIPPSIAPSAWSHDGAEEQTTWTPMTQSDWTARQRDTTSSSVYGGDGQTLRVSRTSGPPIRLVSGNGAQVVPSPVAEEEEDGPWTYSGGKATAARITHAPFVKGPQSATLQEPPKKKGQTQEDMSWLNLDR